MLRKIIILFFASMVSKGVAQQPILKSTVVNTEAKQMGVNLKSKPSTSINENYIDNAKKLKGQKSESELENPEIVIVSKESQTSEVDIYNLPLFGGFEKNMDQLRYDLEFFKDCDRNFNNRKEASEFFAKIAWEYLAEGSKDIALNRFNLAWMLNNQNVDTYWGLGVIAYQKENFEQAEELMKEGLEKNEYQNVTLLVDLATVYIKSYVRNGKEEDINNAYFYLQKAVSKAPNFTNAYMQMSLANLAEGKTDQAWLNFHKGYAIDPNAVSLEILDTLLELKPDPKGVFRQPD